ncbi:hypothetical protein N7481_004711 [Penicillium waksmanii]|uniref:uncharacterized protein n=1 Tax=Penicillium waksmanii TaxID=69791 RepID=UPI002549018E|nr:uncharacterized protein N7481_004711 [Penicillium waksmanii]KAJ5989501.1 hypothetical protein N7481_004711 [Penicillium waksmanii]
MSDLLPACGNCNWGGQEKRCSFGREPDAQTAVDRNPQTYKECEALLRAELMEQQSAMRMIEAALAAVEKRE